MPARRKRQEERIDNRAARLNDITVGELAPLHNIPAPGNWPAKVKRLYEAIFTSGQAHWLQDSDVQYAYMICDDLAAWYRLRAQWEDRQRQLDKWQAMSEEEQAETPKPHALRYPPVMQYQAHMASLNSLLVTEDDRRKARIELHKPDTTVEERPGVIALRDYHKALGM